MTSLYEQYAFNVGRSPLHEDETSIPRAAPTEYPVRFIAYYLPQFHPIAVNDRAWGKGFTEWTNTTKALPRYVGHYQPRLPADLGYYDLRSADVLRQQADLARRGGVYGFCLHNYWFGGQRALETPLELLLANPDIDLPFCLNWANENWSRRWDGAEQDLLLAQSFSPEDDIAYAEALLPAVEDHRYIRINGRPLIMLYRPGIMPDARATIERWREFFIKRGVGNPYVVMSEAHDGTDPRPYGFDAMAGFPPHKAFDGGDANWVRKIDPRFKGVAKPYDDAVAFFMQRMSREFRYFPGVFPAWDNEPRKPGRGTSFFGSVPATYGRWLRAAATQVMADQSGDERIVFINAWNEWAEGAYLEPDRHFGYAYLAETARALQSISGRADEPHGRSAPLPAQFVARHTWRHYLGNRVRGAIAKAMEHLS